MDIDTLNKNALSYNESVSQMLQEIVNPLFDCLGFNHFAYSRFMQGERYMTMSVDATWTKKYFTLDLDKYLIFEKLIIPKYSKRVVIWDMQEDNGLLELLRNSGYFHGLSVFYRHEDVVEGWHFATTSSNTEINDLYTNNLGLIDRFIVYFQERAKKIIDPKDKERLAIYKNKRFLNLFETIDPDSSSNSSYNQFFESTKLKKFPFLIDNHVVYLSPTEFRCLRGISEGLTAKGIGQHLALSNRTVEVNIQKVKEKFDISSKTQLADEFKKSPYWKRGLKSNGTKTYAKDFYLALMQCLTA